MKRREFLKLGALAAASATVPASAYLLKRPRSRPVPKAKSLVVLFMTGGPSQIELFDYKPELYKRGGQTINGFTDEAGKSVGTILSPLSQFARHGKSGLWVSNLIPNLAGIVDDIAILKSVNCTSNNHALAQMEFLTGNVTSGNPFVGAWVNHALAGSRATLPGAVVMTDPLGPPRTNSFAWNSGRLKGASSKVVFSDVTSFANSLGEFFFNEKEQYDRILREQEALANASPVHVLDEPSVQARLENMAQIYSVKEKLKEVLDLSGVTEEERLLYGMHLPQSRGLSEQLLVARRLVEAEVPFVQIYCGNEDDPTSWDHHVKMEDIVGMSKKTDYPIAGFMADLKQRGLLEQTVVLWGGEFGRLPVRDMDQPDFRGRGHNERANTIWLAGAGLKKGISYGETDELSLRTVKDHIEMGDIWATVMHLMGITHEDLVDPFQSGKSFIRPKHRVIQEILA